MTDYTDLQKAAEYAAQDTIKFADESEEMRALHQFHEEVDAETVLALIAELKKVDADRKGCWAEFKVQGRQLDQLKAENEALRSAMHQLASHPKLTASQAEILRAAMGKGEQS